MFSSSERLPERYLPICQLVKCTKTGIAFISYGWLIVGIIPSA
jgi:hypothetical protein